MDTTSAARTQQLNNLRAFRQGVYDHAFTARRDAQFELLDALLSSGPTRSFAELSQAPVFRRTWASAYAALEDGRQDEAWLRQYLVQQLPTAGVLFFAVDLTAWPRPRSPTLEDRQFVHSPTPDVLGGQVVIGQPYSVAAWVAEPGTGWTLPLDISRLSSAQTPAALAAAQIARLDKLRAKDDQAIWVYALDGGYGHLKFWAAVPADERRGVVTRLRNDRVLSGEPGAYSGRGRPRKHGARFAFREPATWGEPARESSFCEERWGEVELRYWEKLHDKAEADVKIDIMAVAVHKEREKPPGLLWLSWQGPELPLEVIWRGYEARWGVETGIAVRKQNLHWTQPALQSLGAMACWTVIVSVAKWVLFMARKLVADRPRPWQRAQEEKTPERVLAGVGAILEEVGSPARAPRRRGKSPGWAKGRVRKRKARQRVVKKESKRPRAPPKAAK